MVSMIGNSLSGFALSLFVLDFAQSTLLYAVFLFVYTLPQIAAPLLAGPLMDRFSRRKTIYILDFFSAAINIVIAGIVYFKFSIFPSSSSTPLLSVPSTAYTALHMKAFTLFS